MNADEINYKTLRRIQEMEKKSPSLTRIEPNFYNDLSKYLENLDDRLGKELSPQKQMLLKVEIRDTNKIVTSIYEMREKKILLATISKARGGNPTLKNLVDVEKDLFESTLELMTQMRKQVLEKKSKGSTEKEKTVESKKEDEKNEGQENSKPVVRVTKSIPKFIGTDIKEYNLRGGDVLSLPADMRDMLLKRGVAKEIKQQ
jgi:DNA replication initiation complex subunit (GINS family)